MMSTIGTIDMFENYRIIADSDFRATDSNEYLLSLDNLKGKYDKQFVFHRQVITPIPRHRSTKHIHTISTRACRAHNPGLSGEGNVEIPLDNQESLAYDMISLEEEGINAIGSAPRPKLYTTTPATEYQHILWYKVQNFWRAI